MIVGERLPTLRRSIELRTLVRYAGASGDFNPIHYDEAYAVAAGLDGVIGHGMLAMALVSEAVTDWVGDSRRVRTVSARFTNPYRVGDVLTVEGEVVACSEEASALRLRCVNQDGVEVIGRAAATVSSERSADG